MDNSGSMDDIFSSKIMNKNELTPLPPPSSFAPLINFSSNSVSAPQPSQIQISQAPNSLPPLSQRTPSNLISQMLQSSTNLPQRESFAPPIQQYYAQSQQQQQQPVYQSNSSLQMNQQPPPQQQQQQPVYQSNSSLQMNQQQQQQQQSIPMSQASLSSASPVWINPPPMYAKVSTPSTNINSASHTSTTNSHLPDLGLPPRHGQTDHVPQNNTNQEKKSNNSIFRIIIIVIIALVIAIIVVYVLLKKRKKPNTSPTPHNDTLPPSQNQASTPVSQQQQQQPSITPIQSTPPVQPVTASNYYAMPAPSQMPQYMPQQAPQNYYNEENVRVSQKRMYKDQVNQNLPNIIDISQQQQQQQQRNQVVRRKNIIPIDNNTINLSNSMKKAIPKNEEPILNRIEGAFQKNNEEEEEEENEEIQ